MNKISTLFVALLFLSACGDGKTAVAVQVKVLASPVGDSSALPHLVTDPTGKVFLSWIEKRNGIASLQFATLSSDQWSTPVTIASGNNWFVNWADYPVVASDGQRHLLAHFLQKRDTSKYAYDVQLTSSGDGGKRWSEPITLHDDGLAAEHGFVSMVPYQQGFFATWLDGRNSAGGHGAGHGGHHGAMTLRGAVLDIAGRKLQEWELDDRVCDCCQTAAAVTDSGLVVVYRNRSDDEVRDMSIVRYANGQWTAPQIVFPDHWRIEGCPVNGPRIDARGGQLAVAWFGMREGKEAQVNVIFSADDGAHFGKPVRIDSGKPLGRVDVLWLRSDTALVSWMEGDSIKATKVTANGYKAPSFLVATSSTGRSSGFPQMTLYGQQVLFAWTDDATKSVQVAVVTL
ncbi:sialidase family protein [Paraflavitalea pollutisoli]|uniref:sialidase family protein n=1 Tax=Paraflavitalea pollutisoli TaxID=3034143 RepID=UPI0023ED042F|nr:sialidase family protein [Paraflavitalea sp. H1-2-19X]